MEARPDHKMVMTTEVPKITEQPTMMTTNMTDGEDVSEEDSMESGEEEPEETESKFIFDGKL
jgi:hypothetical protein